MDNGYKLISSINDLSEFLKDLDICSEIGLDTESSGLDFFKDRLLLVQFCINNHIYVLDVIGLEKDNLTYIIDLVKGSNKTCIGHNIKYDLKVLKANTGILLEEVFDTMVIENVLTAGLGAGFPSLAELLEKYLGIQVSKKEREEFIGAYAVTQEMLLYAAIDVKHIISLKEVMWNELENNKLTKVAQLENKLVPVVADMEFEGVAIDELLWNKLTSKAKEKSIEYGKELLEEAINGIISQLKGKTAFEMCELIGANTGKKDEKLYLKSITEFDYALPELKQRININSNPQILKLLHLNKIPVASTGKHELEKVKGQYKLTDKLSEYRPYSKKVSSFGEDFVQKINPITGRLHANANQIGTSTGRWSYDNPNLQQIPKETEDEDSRYRHCFIARLGHKILTVDYNQAEFRLLGAVSGEPEIIKAYLAGIDLHTLTATKIYYVPIEEVTTKQRWNAKQVNFAVIYGSSEYGLYYNFGIPIDLGRKHLNTFFESYPYVKYFVEYAGEKIWENLYSVTPYGRKRFFTNKVAFPNWRDALKFKQSTIRKGVNMIIQGGSADILKMSLVDIYYNNPFGDALKILMAVHDEGVFEVREDLVNDIVLFIINIMEKNEQIFLGEIPAKVDFKVGDYWSK